MEEDRRDSQRGPESDALEVLQEGPVAVLALAQGDLGPLPVGDLAAQLLVRPGQLLGPFEHPRLEDIVRLAQLRLGAAVQQGDRGELGERRRQPGVVFREAPRLVGEAEHTGGDPVERERGKEHVLQGNVPAGDRP